MKMLLKIILMDILFEKNEKKKFNSKDLLSLKYRKRTVKT